MASAGDVSVVGEPVGSADLVRSGVGLGDGLSTGASGGLSLPPLTWLTVVPSPPDRAWPVTSSTAVSAAAASPKAARAPTSTLDQDSRRRTGRRSVPA